MKQHDDANDLEEVRRILEMAGLRVEDIPVAETKRCDVRADDNDGEHYLIEVKGFHDPEGIRSALDAEGLYVGKRELTRANRVEVEIKDAIKQFQKTPGADEALWIICLLNRSTIGSSVRFRQIHGTLYGTRHIVYEDEPGHGVSRECLYFAESAFIQIQGTRCSNSVRSDEVHDVPE